MLSFRPSAHKLMLQDWRKEGRPGSDGHGLAEQLHVVQVQVRQVPTMHLKYGLMSTPIQGKEITVTGRRSAIGQNTPRQGMCSNDGEADNTRTRRVNRGNGWHSSRKRAGRLRLLRVGELHQSRVLNEQNQREQNA